MRRSSFLLALMAIVVCVTCVAAREFTDSTGNHKIEAEYVAVVGDKVKLKRADGKEILVPLARLSESDQAYVRLRRRRDAFQKQEEDPEKKSDYVPENNVPDDDQQRAKELVDQAFTLFKLDPKGNSKIVSSKLKEASRLNPSSIQADFIRGLLNLLVAKSPKEAEKNFLTCLKRAPNNPAVLNNLAVAEVKMGKFKAALDRWEEMRKVAPKMPFVSHNLGRLLKVYNDEKVKMPKRDADRCAEDYANLVSSKEYPPTADGLGWILMEFLESDKKIEKNRDIPFEIAGGGTGFVVKQKYIVTNKHVVGKAKTVKIKLPNQKDLLDADVTAVSPYADIAVLKCNALSMPPVGICSTTPRRGSDLMVLGYPQFDQLGATLKSTRGAVTSLPSQATENMMLIDAEMNSGNSGGPIANDKGQVIAVATAVFKPVGGTGGKYGAGIPIGHVMSFLRQHVPGIKSQPDGGAALSWPDVDEKVSKSTVLVLVSKEAAGDSHVVDGSKDGKGATFGGVAVPFHDPMCAACNGTLYMKKGFKRIKCPHCRGIVLDSDVVQNLLDRARERKR